MQAKRKTRKTSGTFYVDITTNDTSWELPDGAVKCATQTNSSISVGGVAEQITGEWEVLRGSAPLCLVVCATAARCACMANPSRACRVQSCVTQQAATTRDRSACDSPEPAGVGTELLAHIFHTDG